MKVCAAILAVLVLAAGGTWWYINSGRYNVGADVPHMRFIARRMHRIADHSVHYHAQSVKVPANVMKPDSAMLLQGAGAYASMCSECHLAPGIKPTGLHKGLYPRPPWFRRGTDMSPAEFFWETKHGVKDTGMPAWGKSHSDAELWPIVAFVEHMHGMTPEQYRDIVARAPKDKDKAGLPMPGTAPADTTHAAGGH